MTWVKTPMAAPICRSTTYGCTCKDAGDKEAETRGKPGMATILSVDDSVSLRLMVSCPQRDAGSDAVLANDGIDAHDIEATTSVTRPVADVTRRERHPAPEAPAPAAGAPSQVRSRLFQRTWQARENAVQGRRCHRPDLQTVCPRVLAGHPAAGTRLRQMNE